MKVRELIEALQKLDGELEVVIEDADTDWLMEISEPEERPEHPQFVIIKGGYGSVVLRP